MAPIYLDHNASTPVDPVVAAAMRPFLEGAFGNPSSGHWASAPAKAALETCRAQKLDSRLFLSVVAHENLTSREQRGRQFRAVGGLGNRGAFQVEDVADR